MSAKSHFRVLGVPIRIEPVFWVVTAFLGFNLSDARLIIIWVAVVLVSVLVHELGHAIALKLFGQPSSIVLHGFGGVTLSARRLARTQSIIVSLAGPIAALGLLGIPAYLVRESDYGFDLALDYALSDNVFDLWPVVYFVTYVNIWWSVFNLLPIRPLDGGNVMTELLGIDRARLLSVVAGGGAAIWAYWLADEAFRYAAFFAGFLAFINYSEHRRSKMAGPAPSAFDVEGPAPGHRRPVGGADAGPPTPATRRPAEPRPNRSAGAEIHTLAGGMDPASAEAFAWNLLRRGDVPGARRVLQRANGSVGPFVGPTVAAAAGEGTGELAAAYLANPGGPSNLVPAMVLADSGEALTLAQRLVGEGPAGVEAAGGLQTHLHYSERFEHAAGVGEVVYAVRPAQRAQTAFDIACSWSRAGDVDRAMTWVERAVADGFAATSVLDGEPDLEAVRAHPSWPRLRDPLT